MLHRYNSEMFRRQQEELFRQAEYERMLQAAHSEQRSAWRPYRDCVLWLGTHLVLLGRRLERFGAVCENCPSAAVSPHH